MSTTIDQKVVEMKFDNKQFEQGVSQSINSTEKLKASLDFKDVTSNLNQKMNVTVQGFTALTSVTDQLLRNITNAAWSKWTQILDTLGVSMKNLALGWGKYNTLTKSTQVIMSATRQEWEDQGAQMEFVNEQVKKLNWYTDETSWNLTDMTSNIGKFVSAGVDIETATSAMIGIGSWAGQSGAGVEQMSRAMYNLSQAMALGSVRVQDWMSIENANMATKEFKQTVMDTAVEVGTLTKSGDKYWAKVGKKWVEVTAENFRTTLSANWFDGKVLTTALKKYGDFADGLHSAVEETELTATELLGIIDDYKEAVANGEDMDAWLRQIASEKNISNVTALSKHMEFLTSDYNELGLSAFKASQECKTFEDVQMALSDAMSTSWMGIFNAIVGDYLQAKDLWSTVAEEMYEIFVENLNEKRRAIESWGRMGGREYLLDALWTTWYSIKDIINSVKEGFAEVFPDNLARKLLYFVQDLKNAAEKLRPINWPWYSDLENIKNAAKSLANAVKNILKVVKAVATSIKSAWEQIFPKDADPNAKRISDRVKDIAEAIEKFTKKLVPTEEQSEKLRRTFAGLFAILDILRMLIVALIEPFTQFDNESSNFTDGVLDITASIGDWIVSIRDWLKENDTFRTVVNSVINFIKSIPSKLDKVCNDLFGIGLDEVWENIKNAALTAWEAIKNFFINLPEYAEQASQAVFGMSLAEVFENIKSAASSAWDVIKGFFSGFRKEAPETFDETSESAEQVPTALDNITTTLENTKRGFEIIKPYLDDFKEMLSETFDFSGFTSFNAEETGDLLVSGGIFGVLIAFAAAIAKVITAFDKFEKKGDKIVKSLQGFIDGLTGVTKAVKGRIQADVFKTIATAVLEIAAAILIMSFIKPEKLASVTWIIVAIISEIGVILQQVSNVKGDPKSLERINKILKSMMVIIAEVVAGMYILAKLDPDSVYTAGVMIALLLGEIMLFFYEIGEIKVTKPKANNIMELMKSISLLIAAIGGSIAIIAKLGDWESILAAGAMIALIFAEIGLVLLNLDKIKITEKKVKNIGDIMKAMGVALIMIGAAVAIAASGGDWESIAAGGIVLALMLVAIAGAMKIMPSDSKMKKVGKALVVVGVAMILIGTALAIVGKVPLKGLIPGVIALAVMVAAIGVALSLMSGNADDMLKAAAALVVASAALILMAAALGVMAEVAASGHAAEAMIMMGAALAAVVVAAYACQNPAVQAGLYAVGAAIALIGVGALAAGTGLWMFANAIAILTNLGPEGIQTLSDTLIALFTVLPNLATAVGEAILNLIDMFIANRDRILNGIITFFEIIIQGLYTVLPQILNLVRLTIEAIIAIIIELVPQIVELLRVIFYATNDLIWELAPELVATLIMLAQLAFNALNQLIWEQTPEIVSTIIMITSEILRGLREITPQITQSAIDILIDTLTRINNNIFQVTSLLTQIGLNLVFGLMDGFIQEIPTFINLGIEAMLNFINGLSDAIDDHATEIAEAISRLANSLINAFKEIFGINSPSTLFKGFGSDIIQGLINGIKDMWNDLKSGITTIANDAINAFKSTFGIASPSKVFYKFGEYIDEGLSNGLKDYSNIVAESSEDVGKTAISTVSDAISNVADMMNSDMDTTPTIRPVLDLTDVASGVNAIDGMLDSDRTMNLAATSNNSMNNRVSDQAQITSMFNELKASLNGMSSGNQNGTVNNTFNITGDNPKEIAEEVSRIIQKQIERRDAVWA